MSTYSLITSLLLVITSYRLQPVIVPADLPAASDFPSIRIGEQVWMTKNWDYKTPKSWYFENDSVNNLKYGRLYFYSNAMAAAPPGWHLPSLDEWQELINHFGGDEKALPAKRMGIYMGIFNLTVVIPQIISGLFGGYILKGFFNEQAIYILVFAGCIMILGALAVPFVKDVSAEPGSSIGGSGGH